MQTEIVLQRVTFNSARDQARYFLSRLLVFKDRAGAGDLQIGALHHPKTAQERMEYCIAVVRSPEDIERALKIAAGANTRGAANIFVKWRGAAATALIDDLTFERAQQVARERAALIIETSKSNFQAILPIKSAVSDVEHAQIQRALALQYGGDPGATGATQFFRIPGFTTHKPGKIGQWTNLVFDTSRYLAFLDPREFVAERAASRVETQQQQQQHAIERSFARAASSSHVDRSAMHFAFAVNALKAGVAHDVVVRKIAERALEDGKRKTMQQAMRYAELTVKKAMLRVNDFGFGLER